MKIAQVSDDNVDTVRSWSSYTIGHYSQVHFPCYVIAALYHIRGAPENFIDLLRIFYLLPLWYVCPCPTTWPVLTLRMEKRSADMESSCEYIK